MRLNNLSGYFGVRKYNSKKQRSEWELKGNDESITFDVAFKPEELPAELAPYATKREREDGTTVYYVHFKINSKCKWFTKTGEIERPDNAEIDGTRYNVWIEFNVLNGDPQAKEACGAWANGLLIEKAASNMFADLIAAETPIEQPANDDDELDF